MDLVAIKEYFSKLLSALKIEKQEELKYYEEKLSKTSFVAQRKNGISWFPVQIERTNFDAGERLVVNVKRYPEHRENHTFQSGKPITFFAAASHNDKAFEVQGVINRIKEDSLTITLNLDDEPDWFKHHQLGVQQLFDAHSFLEMQRALNFIIKNNDRVFLNLVDKLVFPESIQHQSQNKVTYKSVNHLNKSQTLAISNCLNTSQVAAIHGPPGTGKTTTMVELIVELCTFENQLLVCAPSNTAVDLLVEKLMGRGIEVVRIGHPARVTQEALDQTIDAKFVKHNDYGLYKGLKRQSEEYFEMGRKYKRNFGPKEREQRRLILNEARKLKSESQAISQQIKQDIIFKSRVVVSTLVGANHTMIKDFKVNTVLIDEAGQAIEPACWIPILKSKRVIFAGDHQQLPPTVKSNEAKKLGLSITLFEKIIKVKHIANLLDVQYRMNSKIMEFSNRWFYEGKLSAHESVINHTIANENPVMFIDTAGAGFEETLDPETLSTGNKDEADFIIKFLDNFKDKLIGKGVDFNDLTIGLIAPYRSQVEYFKQQTFLQNFKNLKISTIDGFQGQERDVLIISLVRSNSKSEIGFLKDYRRMNVAITRARKKLIIVGDSATIGNDPFYKEFVDYTQEIDSYHSVFELNFE